MILNITCGVRDVTLAILDGSLALADFTEGISCYSVTAIVSSSILVPLTTIFW